MTSWVVNQQLLRPLLNQKSYREMKVACDFFVRFTFAPRCVCSWPSQQVNSSLFNVNFSGYRLTSALVSHQLQLHSLPSEVRLTEQATPEDPYYFCRYLSLLIFGACTSLSEKLFRQNLFLQFTLCVLVSLRFPLPSFQDANPFPLLFSSSAFALSV